MNQANLELSVDHPNLSSQLLQNHLEIDPDYSWNIGDKWKVANGSQLFYTFSRWAIVESAKGSQIDSKLSALIKRTRKKSERFRSLPEGSRALLTIYLDDEKGVFGIGIGRTLIKKLSLIGAGVEISIVSRCHIHPLAKHLSQRTTTDIQLS